MPNQTIISFSQMENLVDQQLGPSDWVTVDQERINRFAEATGDFQWIHTDVERANAEMGHTIAHGYLTLSLVAKFLEDVLKVEDVSRGVNYGVNKVRFTNTVPVNSRLRMTATVKEVRAVKETRQITAACKIEIEGQVKPACLAEIVVLYFK